MMLNHFFDGVLIVSRLALTLAALHVGMIYGREWWRMFRARDRTRLFWTVAGVALGWSLVGVENLMWNMHQVLFDVVYHGLNTGPDVLRWITRNYTVATFKIGLFVCAVWHLHGYHVSVANGGALARTVRVLGVYWCMGWGAAAVGTILAIILQYEVIS